MHEHCNIALINRLRTEDREAVIIEFMSKSLRLLARERYTSDHLRAVFLPLRAIAKRALDLDARNITIAHNHPSGDGCPSLSDINATRRLTRLCHDIGIEVCDHLIVTSDQVFSFKQQGML